MNTTYPDSERYIIGAILVDPVTSLEICRQNSLSEHTFSDATCRLAWLSVQHFAVKQTWIDCISVAQDMAQHTPADEGHNWQRDLEHCIDTCHTVTSLPYHCAKVRDAEIRRKVITDCAQLTERANTSDEDAQVLLSETITQLLATHGTTESDATPPQVYTSVFDGWHSAKDRGHKGVPSRWGVVNRVLGGYMPGKLYIVAARPGAGKSTLLGNEALTWALAGVPVSFASLEMAESELRGRMLCEAADVSSYKLDIGEGQPDDFTRLSALREPHAELPIRICDRSMTVEQVVLWATSEVVGRRAQVLVLDYLQIIVSSRRYENRNAEVSQWMNTLRDAAKRLNVPFLLASQLRREDNEGGKPTLQALRDSGSIEQNAYGVLFIHNAKADDGNDTTEFIIAKNRGGPCGGIAMEFMRNRQRFAAKP